MFKLSTKQKEQPYTPNNYKYTYIYRVPVYIDMSVYYHTRPMLVLQTFSQLGQHEGDIAQGWAAVLRLPGMTEASVAIGQFGGFLRHRDTPKIIVRPQDEYPRWRFLKKNKMGVPSLIIQVMTMT